MKVIREAYTTNAICTKNNCVNPIFPGMEDLDLLAQATWSVSSLQKVATSISFCRGAVSYDVTLPSPSGPQGSLHELVKKQDNAAATMFYYHVNGLGLEGWDYTSPGDGDDCIRSIWRMTCYTYFPKAPVGSQEGQQVNYVKPCKSCCQNYIRACQVECCDESVDCVFTHTKEVEGKVVTRTGYSPHDGPSPQCTGGARRSTTPLSFGVWALVMLKALLSLDVASVVDGTRSLFARRRLLFIGVTVTLAMSLQGCTWDVPTHRVGNWRAEPDFLIKMSFIPPGGNAKGAILNSCSLTRLSQTLQCNGRGVCTNWHKHNLENQLSFCKCDIGWADPECGTKRKSQAMAYVLSLFFGMFGADQFYLGFMVKGFAKLFTLGGLGIWWIFDIIRIGSAPVFSSHYRTAADLPHWVFVLTCTCYAVSLGFFLSFKVASRYKSKKLKEALLLQQDEENRQGESESKTSEPKIKPIGYGSLPMGSVRMMGSMPAMTTMGQIPPATMNGMRP